MAHKVAGQIYLLLEVAEFPRNLLPDRLKLEANPRKAQGQCVMYFMREPFAFSEHSLQAQTLEKRRNSMDGMEGDCPLIWLLGLGGWIEKND
jgi:hypothetical protein